MSQENLTPLVDSKLTESHRLYARTAFWLLSFSLILFVLILCGVPRAENDLFWQLRTGHDILQQHAVPYADSYSWTRKGSPWVVHEWLALVLLWVAYSAGHGFAGLFILKAIVASATACVFFRHLCWSTNYKLIPMAFLAGLAMMSVSIGFEVGPQLLTYFFLTLSATIILERRGTGYQGNSIWWLVPIFVVWANVHSGVIAGLFILAAWCLGDYIDGVNRPTEPEQKMFKKRALRLLLVLVVCLAGTLCTPYGISEYTNFAATISSSGIINFISEWASPTLHEASGRYFCVLAGVLFFGVIFSKRFVLLGDTIVFVTFLHYSLMSYRNIPLFALVGCIVAVPYLRGLTSEPEPGDPRNEKKTTIFGAWPGLLPVYLAALGIVFIAFVSTFHSYKQEQMSDHTGSLPLMQLAAQSVSTGEEPVSGVRFVRSSAFPLSWKMYNSYENGGYLIWNLPQYPVSIDSRADLYRGGVIDDYLKLNRLSYSSKTVLAKYPSDFIMASATSGISKLAINSQDWALVYAANPDLDLPSGVAAGEDTLVFVRRRAQNNPEIIRIRKLCPTISSPTFMSTYGEYPGVH